MKIVYKTESQDTIALAGLLLMYQRKGKVTLYSKIAHETFTKSVSARRKNTLEGLRPGVPDFIIVIGTKVIFLELKRKVGGVVSPEQEEWHTHLQGKTTEAVILKGFDQAKAYLDSVIKGGE